MTWNYGKSLLQCNNKPDIRTLLLTFVHFIETMLYTNSNKYIYIVFVIFDIYESRLCLYAYTNVKVNG